MEIYSFLTFLGLIASILNIILFFKIWGMTNNIKGLHKLTFLKEIIEIEPSKTFKEELEDTIYKETLRNAGSDNERSAIEKELDALWEEKKKK